MELDERKIILISGIAFLAVIAAAISFYHDTVIFSNLVFIGMLALVLPYSFYRFLEYKRIREYENNFPNFLRDLAESQRAGMSIVQAIDSASRSDYGRLAEEVKVMNNQLSWNIPLETVLKNFSKRMRRSRMIVRSIAVISEANKSGGNVDETMESLAGNIEMIKDVQEEKATLLNQHVIMMYAIFFIFLGISIALVKFLVPMVQIQEASSGMSNIGFSYGTNPCQECIKDTGNPACLGCSIFFGISDSFSFGKHEDVSSYYKALFFSMIIIQGICSGLIAGQIGSDSISAGIKHSLVMMISGFIIFIFMVRVGFI